MIGLGLSIRQDGGAVTTTPPEPTWSPLDTWSAGEAGFWPGGFDPAGMKLFRPGNQRSFNRTAVVDQQINTIISDLGDEYPAPFWDGVSASDFNSDADAGVTDVPGGVRITKTTSATAHVKAWLTKADPQWAGKEVYTVAEYIGGNGANINAYRGDTGGSTPNSGPSVVQNIYVPMSWMPVAGYTWGRLPDIGAGYGGAVTSVFSPSQGANPANAAPGDWIEISSGFIAGVVPDRFVRATTINQSVAPILRSAGGRYYLQSDGVDDAATINLPAGTYTRAWVDIDGQVTIESGVAISGAENILRTPLMADVFYVDRPLTPTEVARWTAYWQGLYA